MAHNQNWSARAGGGGFLRILGIIYLIKIIRRRRQQQQQEQHAEPEGSAEGTARRT